MFRLPKKSMRISIIATLIASALPVLRAHTTGLLQAQAYRKAAVKISM
jgi:hypothetical protein